MAKQDKSIGNTNLIASTNDASYNLDNGAQYECGDVESRAIVANSFDVSPHRFFVPDDDEHVRTTKGVFNMEGV